MKTQHTRTTSSQLTIRTVTLAALLIAPFALCAQDQPATVVQESTAQTNTPAEPAPGVSHIRIVRLSQVNGQVQLDRGNTQKFEPAVVNSPIVARERLQTQDGLAEVEFEDNSSIRLATKTLVEFPVLERSASGSTSSSVKLVSGTLYASMAPGKGLDRYTVTIGNRIITLIPSSHLRIDASSPAKVTLTVFKGNVPVDITEGTGPALLVGKKKALTFDPTTEVQPALARASEEEGPYDAWDKNSTAYHSTRVSSAYAGSPYSYGLSDLSYYGAFSNAGGCGSLWRPYLVSAAWDPYASGVWSMYPGAGYSWVSPYPWGWTPYHSGSWQYCNGSGWGWRPQGGSWNGLGNSPALRLIEGTGVHRPIPRPPGPGQPSLVVVNLKSIPVSRTVSDGSFAFQGNSAGVGVPRGVFSNLGKLSHSAEQHNFAPTNIGENQIRHGLAFSNSPESNAHTLEGNRSSFARGNENARGNESRNAGPAAANRSNSSSEGGRNAGYSNASRSSGPPPSFSAPVSHSAPSVSAPSSSAGAAPHR